MKFRAIAVATGNYKLPESSFDDIYVKLAKYRNPCAAPDRPFNTGDLFRLHSRKDRSSDKAQLDAKTTNKDLYYEAFSIIFHSDVEFECDWGHESKHPHRGWLQSEKEVSSLIFELGPDGVVGTDKIKKFFTKLGSNWDICTARYHRSGRNCAVPWTSFCEKFKLKRELAYMHGLLARMGVAGVTFLKTFSSDLKPHMAFSSTHCTEVLHTHDPDPNTKHTHTHTHTRARARAHTRRCWAWPPGKAFLMRANIVMVTASTIC